MEVQSYLHLLKGVGMYFWGTIAVLFVLACVAGWRFDRKRRGEVNGRARESMDGRANETVLHNQNNYLGGGDAGGGSVG